MEQDIYLDVYFSFNFLMDFFVLFLTGIIIKNNKKYIEPFVYHNWGNICNNSYDYGRHGNISKSIGIFQKV